MSGLLTTEEYNRRKQFLEEILSLTNAELIEIVRILRAHKFVYSENTNGVFFNIAAVSQSLFEELNSDPIDDIGHCLNTFLLLVEILGVFLSAGRELGSSSSKYEIF